MISANIDRAKLEQSLKDFAKDFGETNAQAIVRWSVNACRELAFETQVWGKTKTKAKQEGAIIADAYNVINIVERVGKNKKALHTPEEVNSWIEQNRTRRRARTAKLPISERRVCTRAIFNKAMRIRFQRAGMAKGGWLGAGQEIAKAQKGQDRINIGKNYLSYAQKHGHFGSAKKPMEGWSPFAEITNRVSYSGDKNVLTAAAPSRAFDWSLKKTIKWYRSALRAINQKKP